MRAAIVGFDALDEPEDWGTAHQKPALVHRGAGDLGEAARMIEVAQSAGSGSSPVQWVRLGTARGHILLSDPASVGEGLALLNEAASQAATYGTSHQLRAVERIRGSLERGGAAVRFR
ncbi:hypothetical protein ACW14Y_05155 [Kitasatospora sp. cg17-2]